MKYYPQLDSLRAISIILVILYHIGFSLFEGGFVGVDVFFVLSGYLIAHIIYNETKTFILSDFYINRFKRLLPAIFTVLIFVLGFSMVFLSPFQIKENAESIISIIFFYSNFHFWKSFNYFSTSTEFNPLVHIWSLSLEFQFYFFFPIFVFIAKRLKFENFLIIIIILISLFLAQFSGNLKLNFPFYDPKFNFYSPSVISNFYLPFARIWEFFFGVLAYKILKTKNFSNIEALYFKLIGILLILISCFSFNKNTPFPSIYTLLPVLGAFCFILGHKNNDIISRILSNKFIVFQGVLSFSLYLFHQPVYSFGRLVFPELNFINIIILFLITYIFSFITYKFIEKPIRNKNFNKILVIKILLISNVIFLIICFPIVKNPEKFNLHSKKSLQVLNPKKSVETCKQNKIEKSKLKYCYFGSKNHKKIVVLTGDSHSVALFKSLEKLFENKNITGLFIRNYSCKRLFLEECLDQQDLLIEFLKNKNVDSIIVSYRWPMRLLNKSYNMQSNLFAAYDQTDEHFIEKTLKDFLFKFKDQKFKKIYVLNNVPEISHIVYENIRNQILFKNFENVLFDYKTHKKNNRLFDNAFKKIAEDKHYIVIDPTNIFCEENKISKKNMCFSQKNYIPFFFDTNHVSVDGANLINKKIIEKLIK